MNDLDECIVKLGELLERLGKTSTVTPDDITLLTSAIRIVATKVRNAQEYDLEQREKV